MTTEHQATQEEKAFGQFLDEIWEVLSEPARALIGEAQSAAYAGNLVHNYCFQPEEYDEAIEKMCLAAARLTEREHELLAKLWRAALAAAASIDSDDFETHAGHKVCSGNLHYYYRMLSSMIEKTLQARKADDRRKEPAEQEPIDYADHPF